MNRSPDPDFHSLSDNFAAGGAWAGLGHLAPEVGIMLTPNIGLSLEGRFQYIPQPSKYARFTSQGALSGLAKLMRLHEAEPGPILRHARSSVAARASASS